MTNTPATNPLTVAEARDAVLRAIVPIADTENVAIDAALGRILATDLVSPIDVPAHDCSAMDGYALRSQDLREGTTALAVVGTAYAGRPFAGAVGENQAVRIMTGAVIPSPCDTVVVQEAVQRDGAHVQVPVGPHAGLNRRLRGEDLSTGSIAIAAGRRLQPVDVGLASSLGLTQLAVRRRVRVAVFSTGDELLLPGQPARVGAIYDSNRYALQAMLQRLGMETVDLGVLRDDPAVLERALLDAAATVDVILTSGGVSSGDADFVRQVVSRHGRVNFWKIAMKPGRPLAFGQLAAPQNAGRPDTYLFGLPGNPVAALVAFSVFVRDALLKLGGASETAPLLFAARSAVPIRKLAGRDEFQRGMASTDDAGVLHVTPAGDQGSAMLHAMSQANCLIILPAHQGDVRAGDTVRIRLFDGLL